MWSKKYLSYIYNSNEKGRSLADAFSVSAATISGIRHGRTWRHITNTQSKEDTTS